MAYNASSWYWVCVDRPNVVFSSSLPGWVPIADAAYEAWLSEGNLPTGYRSDVKDGELADVLTKANVNPTAILAVAPTDWGSVSGQEAYRVALAAGVVLASTAAAHLNATYETSGQSFDDLQDLLQYVVSFGQFPLGATTQNWRARDKQITFNTTDELKAICKGIADYIVGWRSWSVFGGSPPKFGSVEIP